MDGEVRMKRGKVIMYKKQMTVQKVICLLSIIASVVLFIYALGFSTDVYDYLKAPIIPARANDALTYLKAENPAKYAEVEAGSDFIGIGIYEEMDAFNKDLLLVSIGAILLALLLYISNTASRRKYYIGNYVTVGLNVVYNVAAGIWMHQNVVQFRAKYLTCDFDAIKWIYQEKIKEEFSMSTFWFDVHYLVLALSLLAAVLLVLNTIWKINLMKEEKSLIQAGKEQAA